MKKYLLFIILVGVLLLGVEYFKQPIPQRLPDIQGAEYRTILAEVSAYNPLPEQTDDSPFIMASGKRVYESAIACPRWLELNTIVEIFDKKYTCEDRMNIRYENHFDIMMWDYQDAMDFGRQILKVKIYK